MSLRILVLRAAFALALPGVSAFAQSSTAPAAPSTTTPATKPAATAPAATKPAPGTAQTPATGTPKTPTPGQQALRERQKACGAEWRAAKTAGKIPAGQTWPKYWSACNQRLKAKGT